MKTILVESKTKMEHKAVIKLQLVFYCYVNKLDVPDVLLDCVMLHIQNNYSDLSTLCKGVCEHGLFKSEQSARNAIVKLQKKGIFITEGKNKKKISVSPKINIVSKGNILLNYNILGIEPDKE